MHRTKRNMISVVIAQIVTIITGFLVQRYILITYGSTYNGLTSSVTQILQYLVLLEAGLTTASIQALYKPITEHDSKTISGILSATKKKFFKVGEIFLTALLVSSFVLPFVVGDEVSYWFAFAITVASGIGTGLTYMLINKYQALFFADNRTGLIYNLTSIANIAICVVKIVLMVCGLSIIYVQAAALLGVLIRLSVMRTIFKKDYPDLSLDEEPRYDLISKSNNVLIHQIAGFVHNNTDVLLITVFADLKSVSLYTVYNMVYSHVNSLMQSVFAQAPMGYFGQFYAKDKKGYNELFSTFETGYTCVTFIVMTAVMEMVLPFVSLYTRGVNDINYINPLLAWLFFFAQTLNLVRIPSILTVNVSGNFKETQRGAIIEAIINLSVSIPLFFVCGVYGLLIGTIAAMLYRSIDITSFTYKNICEKRMPTFFTKMIIHFAIAVGCIILSAKIIEGLATNWMSWILCGIRSFLITGIVFAVFDFILYRNEMTKFGTIIKNIVKR